MMIDASCGSKRALLSCNARLIRKSRQIAARQDGLSKIQELNRSVGQLREQLKQWTFWYAGTSYGDNLVLLPIEKHIAARVRAKADSIALLIINLSYSSS
jgi:predicted ATPase